VASDINKPDGITVIPPEMADTAAVILKNIKPLLSKTEAGDRKVRLLGISISNFHKQNILIEKTGQLPLPLKFPGEAMAEY